MELYNRLINEGVFIFWEDDKKSDSYLLKLYIFQSEKKVELFSEEIPGNRHCFSADKLGSGDYQIELNSFKNGKVIETIEKKVNMSSSIQKLVELKDSIESVRSAVNSIDINIDTSSADRLLEVVKDPTTWGNGLDAYAWAEFLSLVYRRLDR